MSVDPLRLGLAIASPIVTPNAPNYRPPTWPPASDWPVIVDAAGRVISRWGDSVWRLDPWAGKARTLNFGDGCVVHCPPIDPDNANLLRRIVGWWIWGPNGVRTVGTLRSRFDQIRAVFVQCAKAGILASDLMRFPRVADRLPEVIAPSGADSILQLLHTIYEQRDDLGFTLLDRAGLARLEAALPAHQARQTPYIPPRIWQYQVTRLRECLDDFLAHREQVEACFGYCLDAYATNYGSLAAALTETGSSATNPFQSPPKVTGARSGKRYLGPFVLTAEKFGIDALLERWVGPRGRKEGFASIGIDSFSGYLLLVSRAGLAYLMNFSLMRIEEGWNLRSDCLHVEDDARFGPIYTVRGATTKTMHDDEAIWITSPSVQAAIDAMASIAALRMTCAQSNPLVPVTPKDISHPYLQSYVFEPWKVGREGDYHIRRAHPSYQTVLAAYPKLFDPEQLRITRQDLDLARLVTPTLDADKFAIGKVWPLAWHQLRRTGAVNMQASGLVSDASLQYQLKHASRAMSLYYGRGYSRVRFEEDAQTLYIRTLYEMLGREFVRLTTDRFVSPHGDKRKAEIVRFIAPGDMKKLTKLAKEGRVACREILLGVCTNRAPCSYGGIDSVAHCGGGDAAGDVKPCPEVLYDRDKGRQVKALDLQLGERLANAPPDSPLKASLEAQKRSVRNYLHVIESD
ncbi:hypothetical protein [Pseudoduganella aquatica]|uniref:hypothetical protein n=1 Tax=Pseudoduganella aquatica TaxID=2660641 RepID=UPI001E474BCE|nr:hypothetical protein [Pseudoduganella aquatica]